MLLRNMASVCRRNDGIALFVKTFSCAGGADARRRGQRQARKRRTVVGFPSLAADG
ncbi:hypothetical protein [Stenotrophomonas sp.]|uniref:hypothetical protein n=1 Tax=Stenotrophomonas sp. TaxID=69392 RepID=UPI002FCCA4A1